MGINTQIPKTLALRDGLGLSVPQITGAIGARYASRR